MIAAALLLVTATELSRSLTAAAETLLAMEKKIAASNDDLGSVLYEDVLALLDKAIEADPQNLHAHARAAEVLLLKSDEGDGTFDVCFLLDARNEADLVLSRASRGEPPDVALARGVLRAIDRIPPEAIPDPPSSCNDQERQPGSSKTSVKTR